MNVLDVLDLSNFGRPRCDVDIALMSGLEEVNRSVLPHDQRPTQGRADGAGHDVETIYADHTTLDQVLEHRQLFTRSNATHTNPNRVGGGAVESGDVGMLHYLSLRWPVGQINGCGLLLDTVVLDFPIVEMHQAATRPIRPDGQDDHVHSIGQQGDYALGICFPDGGQHTVVFIGERSSHVRIEMSTRGSVACLTGHGRDIDSAVHSFHLGHFGRPGREVDGSRGIAIPTGLDAIITVEDDGAYRIGASLFGDDEHVIDARLDDQRGLGIGDLDRIHERATATNMIKINGLHLVAVKDVRHHDIAKGHNRGNVVTHG